MASKHQSSRPLRINVLPSVQSNRNWREPIDTPDFSLIPMPNKAESRQIENSRPTGPILSHMLNYNGGPNPRDSKPIPIIGGVEAQNGSNCTGKFSPISEVVNLRKFEAKMLAVKFARVRIFLLHPGESARGEGRNWRPRFTERER